MKIRLLQNIPRVGKKGLVISVHSELAKGYVRRKLAKYVDPEAAAAFEAQRMPGRFANRRHPLEHKAIHPEPAPLPDLEGLKKAELVALASELGLDTKGTKAILIERIEAARN